MSSIRQQLISFQRTYPQFLAITNLLDWAITLLLAITFFYAVANLGGTRESVLNRVSVMVGLLVVLHAFWWRLAAQQGCRIDWRAAWPWPFLVFGWISSIWISPWSWSGQGEMLQWTLGAAYLWVVVHHPRDRDKLWVLLFAVVATAMFCCYWAFHQKFLAKVTPWVAGPPIGLEDLPRQMVRRIQASQFEDRSSGTFGSPNNFAGFLLLAIPSLLVGAGLNRFGAVIRLLLGYSALVAIVSLYFSVSRAGLLCLLGTLVLIPIFAFDSWKRRLVAYLAGGIILAYGGYFLYNADSQLRERLNLLVSTDTSGSVKLTAEWSRPYLWKVATQLWKEEPVLGIGAGGYDHAFEKYRPDVLQRQAVHVHNDYLNILCDYGVVGCALLFVPVFGILLWVLYRWRLIPKKVKSKHFDDRSPSNRVILGGSLLGLLAVGVHSFVDFHFKIPALVFLIAMHFALIFRALPLEHKRQGRPYAAFLRYGYFAIFLCGGLQLGWHGWRIFESERLVFEGREFLRGSILIDNPELRNQKVREALQSQFAYAAAWNPGNAQAWAYKSMATIQLFRDHPKNYMNLGSSALASARRALALSERNWFFHVVEGMSLQMLNRPFDEMIAPFRRAAELAPNNAQALCYLAQALAMDDFERIHAVEVVKRVLELDPTNQTALNLRSNLQQP